MPSFMEVIHHLEHLWSMFVLIHLHSLFHRLCKIVSAPTAEIIFSSYFSFECPILRHLQNYKVTGQIHSLTLGSIRSFVQFNFL